MANISFDRSIYTQVCVKNYNSTERNRLLAVPTAREVLRDDGVRVIFVSDLFREESMAAVGCTDIAE